jgi:hypothetical protein
MEHIKNNMIYNFSYKDIENLKSQGRYYGLIENINLDNFKGKNLMDLFTKNKPENKSYLEMTIEGDKVYKVNLKFYVKILKKEKVMECEFYKGNYKR